MRNNQRRFLRRLGVTDLQALVQVDQVHGRRVVPAESAKGCEADGIVCAQPDKLVGVRTADCAPVLLVATDADHRPEAVAAVHAGWRGAVGGVVQAGVQALLDLGATPALVFAAVGPCIGVEHFEVGEEVVEAAAEALGTAPKARPGPRGRPHLDLADLVRRLLMQSGLSNDHIDVLGRCTYEEAALFFSYRRDRGETGRHLSAIGIRSAP